MPLGRGWSSQGAVLREVVRGATGAHVLFVAARAIRAHSLINDGIQYPAPHRKIVRPLGESKLKVQERIVRTRCAAPTEVKDIQPPANCPTAYSIHQQPGWRKHQGVVPRASKVKLKNAVALDE